MLSLAAAGLVRATLVISEPPVGEGNTPGAELHRLNFQFNPEQLTVNRSNTYPRTPVPDAEKPAAPEFTGAGPRRLSLEFFFDAEGSPLPTVQDNVHHLLSCCEPTRESIIKGVSSPPWVRLEWGRAHTVCFHAYVSEVKASYTLFNHDGTPLRAVCDVSLVEIGGPVPGQNPTSRIPTPISSRRVKDGDALALYAWDAYGDPTAWRAIAQANGIDNPLRLPPGSELLVPAAVPRTGPSSNMA